MPDKRGGTAPALKGTSPMTLRCASLLAAAALAATAAPALAQDSYDPGPPPPLPAWEDEVDDYREEIEEEWEEDPWEKDDIHHRPPPHAMGYPPDQRAAWLEDCRARYEGASGGHPTDECEAWLLRYEHGYRGHGPGYGPGHHAGAWGYHYPYPYPVMWVRVPIVTERRDCGCETVVEEWTEEEPAPPRVRRAPPPGDKRIRITK
jgi:hypothetical protein